LTFKNLYLLLLKIHRYF